MNTPVYGKKHGKREKQSWCNTGKKTKKAVIMDVKTKLVAPKIIGNNLIAIDRIEAT